MHELRYLYESELEFLERQGFISYEMFEQYVYETLKQTRGETNEDDRDESM